MGEERARGLMITAYGILEERMNKKTWMVGESFSMADCLAYPALYYGNLVEPFEKTHPNLAAYFQSLKQRPSFARVLEEAKPYLHLFPYKK